MPPDNINVLTVDVPPLTLEQARKVANEIRRTRVGGGVDRAYWPWVIETLCGYVDLFRQEIDVLSDEVEALRKELEWLKTKTVRSELDSLRTEKTGEAQ